MSKPVRLWIVGFNDPDQQPWEVVGVFEDRPDAVAACIDWRYFIAPAVLNQKAPEDRVTWPDCEYPNPIHVPGHREAIAGVPQ